MDSRCKQVSRLGFILPARLPAFAVAFVAFVSFTVTGIARKLHPIPMTLFNAAHFAQIHRLFICHLHYNRSSLFRQFGFVPARHSAVYPLDIFSRLCHNIFCFTEVTYGWQKPALRFFPFLKKAMTIMKASVYPLKGRAAPFFCLEKT